MGGKITQPTYYCFFRGAVACSVSSSSRTTLFFDARYQQVSLHPEQAGRTLAFFAGFSSPPSSSVNNASLSSPDSWAFFFSFPRLFFLICCCSASSPLTPSTLTRRTFFGRRSLSSSLSSLISLVHCWASSLLSRLAAASFSAWIRKSSTFCL
jgi:hypothetical protein